MEIQEVENSGQNQPQLVTSPDTIEECVADQPREEKKNPNWVDLDWTDEAKEYIQEVKKDKILTYADIEKSFMQNMRRIQRIIEPAPISYDAAKHLIFNAIKVSLAQQGKTPIWDQHTVHVLPKLIKYFIGSNDSGLDLRKGIFLMGETGKGKTFLMKTLMSFASALQYEARKFKFAGINGIQFQIQKEGNIGSLEKYLKGIYCFDDLGSEKDVMIYGSKVKIFDQLLQIRYESYQNYGLITHATSNVDESDLANLYDERTVSRMKEMFNFVYWGGQNKRE